MKYKAGDMVRIRSKEWYDARPRDGHYEYDVRPAEALYSFTSGMAKYAGKIFTIDKVCEHYYCLKMPPKAGIDVFYNWEDWMFDPDYIPDESISTKDAIRAMLDGEAVRQRRPLGCL
jgi:hypothetical protein